MTPEGPISAGSARDSSDDTIALELTEEQRLALSRAAPAAAPPDESEPVPAAPAYMNFAYRPTARIEFVCNVTLAVLALGFATALLWPRPERHAFVPPPAIAAPVAEVIPAPAPPEPEGSPVRITNAFDATEVFEFPHGTSKSEAREAVVELLLSRARARQAEGLTTRRPRNRQRVGGEARMLQPPVSVTRLLARTKVPLSEAN
jgi:hypothetical protein